MKRITFLLLVVVTVVGVVAFKTPWSGHADGGATPIFVTLIPPGYRDWGLISVAHEEGDLNDFVPFWAMTQRSRRIGMGSFRSRRAQSLPESPGVTLLRMRTTKSLAVPNRSSPDRPRIHTSSLWLRYMVREQAGEEPPR
jgi:hypothetical protein